MNPRKTLKKPMVVDVTVVTSGETKELVKRIHDIGAALRYFEQLEESLRRESLSQEGEWPDILDQIQKRVDLLREEIEPLCDAFHRLANQSFSQHTLDSRYNPTRSEL